MPVQDLTAAAIETLTSLLASHESQSEFHSNIAALIQSKLYHQLTVNIIELCILSRNTIIPARKVALHH